jgi:alpha-tubulin suppressor-like RCC1 family protein
MSHRTVAVMVAVLLVAGVVASSGGPAGAQDGPGDVSAGDANEGGPGFVAAQSRFALGTHHSCALLDDGTVRCWGLNDFGQLGSAANSGTNNPNPAPQPAVNLAGHAAVAVTAGNFHSCALLDDGTVRCWGLNNLGQLGSATNNGTINPNPTPQPAVNLGGRTAVAVTAGNFHSCALLDDASVRCWGHNYYGQLGSATNNGTGNSNPAPQPAVNLGPGRTAVAVTAGNIHSCALLDDGTVRCWGNNASGELGSAANNGTDNPNPTPQPAVNLGSRSAVAVSADGAHSCALLDDGTVRCWGNNRYGELGSAANNGTINPNPTPQPAVNLGGRSAVAVTAGEIHSCALLDDGTVRCWGYNYYGELGSATNNATDNPNPTPQPAVNLGAGRTAAAVTAGNVYSCALLDDGTVRCWGNNYYGQLGSATNNGTINPNPTPQPAVALPAILLPPPPPPTGLVVAPTTSPDDGNTVTVSWTTPAASPADPILSYEVSAGGQSTVIAAANADLAAAATKAVTLMNVDRSVAQTVAVTATTTYGKTSSASVTAPALRSRIFVSNVIASGPAQYDFLFAPPGAPVVTGDWNGDGNTGFASRVGNLFTLVDERGNPQGSAGYGKSTDDIFIGDWNANNQDTFAVRRGNIFYLRNTPTSGPADIVLGYGTIGDEVFVGDWNGNGQDTFAVRRGNVFYVRNSTTSGPADVVFGYGKAGDEVLVGDWNQDGIDTFAVRRGNVIFIRNDFQTGIAEITIGYGKAGDTLLVGDYNNDGTDTFAVQRLEPTP